VILKIFAYGIAYFKDKWNFLDFVVALLGILGYVLLAATGTNHTLPLTVIRAFKII